MPHSAYDKSCYAELLSKSFHYTCVFCRNLRARYLRLSARESIVCSLPDNSVTLYREVVYQ